MTDLELINWALTIKPGDYIATCEGCNRKVEEVNVWWESKTDFPHIQEYPHLDEKGYFIYEVEFIDTNGRIHVCPGGGCALPKETPEEVTEYFRSIVSHDSPNSFSEEQEKEWGWCEKFEKIRKALAEGQPIVDEYGELLPEFDD